jgi:hypothetical protein
MFNWKNLPIAVLAISVSMIAIIPLGVGIVLLGAINTQSLEPVRYLLVLPGIAILSWIISRLIDGSSPK